MNKLVLLSLPILLGSLCGAACGNKDDGGTGAGGTAGTGAAGSGGTSGTAGTGGAGTGGTSGGTGGSAGTTGGTGGSGTGGSGATGGSAGSGGLGGEGGDAGDGGTSGTGGTTGDGKIQIYGTWHCGTDGCHWGDPPDMAEFDADNHWLIDRGDGHPSVNLVILSFVNPKNLLEKTNGNGLVNGVPAGMTPEVIDYFKSRGVRVMLSVGGITYVKDWESALMTNATELGTNAAAAARELGVGIEIDYEDNSEPLLDELDAFIKAYRAAIPYDATGKDHAARLTIDFAAGAGWLVALQNKAVTAWLDPKNPMLDYGNAMVPGNSQPEADVVEGHWTEHVEGTSRVPALAPAKFTGGIWLHGNLPICKEFAGSVVEGTRDFVENVAPVAGTTPGMLGYMFWVSGCDGGSRGCTAPPNSCEGGVGAGAKALGVPIPMPALRQE